MTAASTTPAHIKAIQDYASARGFKPDASGSYVVPDNDFAHKIYSHAASQRYKGTDLDTAFGWQTGTADKWAESQGMSKLMGPAASTGTSSTAASTSPAQPVTSTAAPTPAPTPAPAPSQTAGSIMAKAMADARTALGTTAPAPAAAPAPAPASVQGQAAQTTISENQTAAGRLSQMLSQGSPLMEAARLRGNQEAASRGMLGSTMGIEAAQKAMIEAASPLAQTDASIFGQAAIANTAQANTWNAADLDRLQQESQFGRSLTENARQADLSAAAQLSVAGMNYDLQDRRLSQDQAQFLQTYDLERRQVEAQIAQFEQQFGLERDKLTQQQQQYYDGLQLERSKLDQQASQFAADWQNKFSLENVAAANRIDLANIDAQNKKDLMSIEAAYKQEIAGNETISNAWGTMMQEIGRIQNNPDLDDGAKKTLINNSIGSFGSFTSFWKKATGGSVDVSDLLNFSVTNVSGPVDPAAQREADERVNEANLVGGL